MARASSTRSLSSSAALSELFKTLSLNSRGFPENVRLHWSTTLPITAAELSDEDNLEIMVLGLSLFKRAVREVQMAENPMLSLILYYFSADLKTTVAVEACHRSLKRLLWAGHPEPPAAHRVSLFVLLFSSEDACPRVKLSRNSSISKG